MSEVSYSTIKEGETGKRIALTLPCDLFAIDTEEDIALARAIHDDIQKQIEEWFDDKLGLE